jgi:hypothetical protein
MKNVEEVVTGPAFRIEMEGAPRPNGWAVKYVSGMEGKPDIEPGYWLYWMPDSRGPLFRFEPTLAKTFSSELDAIKVAALLRNSEIETVVEKVG